MSERLTDEDLDVLRLNVSSLSLGEPSTPEYVGEFVRRSIKGQVNALISELREHRARELEPAEVEALQCISIENSGMLPWLKDDEEIAWRKRAIAALDKLTKART